MQTKTGNNNFAIDWFLTHLVKKGLGKDAFNLAKKSNRSNEIFKRLRRAWLCTNPELASQFISKEDMSGDSIGEFLVQGSLEKSVQYLRKVTDNGIHSIPGAIWAGVGTEKEIISLRTVWNQLKSTNKTLEAVLMAYLRIYPLYSSYQMNTKKDKQFSEMLRMSGYGEYKYQEIDSTLIKTLVAWSETSPSEVKSVLRAMWKAIKPVDAILRVDWFRNAMFTRCCNMFAADPEILIQDFVNWRKRELVEKGRSWQVGKTVYTLKYPDSVPLQYCLISTATLANFSVTLRDQILLSGLEKFRGIPTTIDTAAQLYNNGKEALDIEPPIQLDSRLLEAWQLGIVKNAIQSIIMYHASTLKYQ